MDMCIRATRDKKGIVRIASGAVEPWEQLKAEASCVERVAPLADEHEWRALYHVDIDGYRYLYAVSGPASLA
jgi:hypothetical protein